MLDVAQGLINAQNDEPNLYPRTPKESIPKNIAIHVYHSIESMPYGNNLKVAGMKINDPTNIPITKSRLLLILF